MKLSIITINYNNKDGLRETIESVRSQSFTDYEWLIIDGGSSDGSKDIIFDNKDCFAYWCSEPDKGIYNAMNKGVLRTKGEYLLFLNSGDRLANSNVLYSVFSKSHISDILYGDKYNLKGVVLEIQKFNPNLNFSALLHRNAFSHQSMFIRRELMQQYLYDESYRISGDGKFVFECACLNKSFEYLDMPISIFDTTGISSNNYLDLLVEDERSHRELINKYFKGELARRYENEWFLSLFRVYVARQIVRQTMLSNDKEQIQKLEYIKADSYLYFLKELVFSLRYSSFIEAVKLFCQYPPIMWYIRLMVSMRIKQRMQSLLSIRFAK